VDTNWYLDINRFARETSWAHGFMTAYASTSLAPVGAGLLFMALLVVAGCLSARREPESMPAAAWAGLGALVALGTGLALAGWVGRARP
jgi:CHASE2 domain-containing sensor protein